jgi:hypothetical protein
MTPAGTTYRLIEGHGLLIHHTDELVRLVPDTPVRRSAPSEPARADDDELPLAA